LNCREPCAVKIINYLDLNKRLIDLRFQQDRTANFTEIFHAHQGIEFLYVHQGKGWAIIDKHVHEIKPDTLLFFRPFQLHRVKIDQSSGSRYIRSLLIFEPHVLRDYLSSFPTLNELFHNLCASGSTNQIFHFESGEMDSLIRLHRQRTSGDLPADGIETKVIFLIDFLAMLLPKWKEADIRANVPPQTTIGEIMEWLDRHYMEPFELDKLAKAVHLSTVHVSSLFRKKVGCTITEYLTARRIRQACLLLKTEDMTVGEVGEAVGFSNASYFCQLFRKYVGISPHRFKKLERMRAGQAP
jgi:AraC-like DNA-binding protein